MGNEIRPIQPGNYGKCLLDGVELAIYLYYQGTDWFGNYVFEPGFDVVCGKSNLLTADHTLRFHMHLPFGILYRRQYFYFFYFFLRISCQLGYLFFVLFRLQIESVPADP